MQDISDLNQVRWLGRTEQLDIIHAPGQLEGEKKQTIKQTNNFSRHVAVIHEKINNRPEKYSVLGLLCDIWLNLHTLHRVMPCIQKV